jgi:hypothetical protein
MPFLYLFHAELGRLKRWFQEFPPGISLSVGSPSYSDVPGTLVPHVCTVVVPDASLRLRFLDKGLECEKVGSVREGMVIGTV